MSTVIIGDNQKEYSITYTSDFAAAKGQSLRQERKKERKM